MSGHPGGTPKTRHDCQRHYCAWCCGCGVCMAADKEWQRAQAVPTVVADSTKRVRPSK